jgi:hypothetical protein
MDVPSSVFNAVLRPCRRQATGVKRHRPLRMTPVKLVPGNVADNGNCQSLKTQDLGGRVCNRVFQILRASNAGHAVP